MPIRYGELFAGYGGAGMALEAFFPGAEPAWFSEIEPGPCAVLTHHWPDTPNLGDVTTIDFTQVEPVDVLHSSFPCQSVSSAGRKAGMNADTPSGLWEHTVRAIGALQPSLVTIENVRGLLSTRVGGKNVGAVGSDVGGVGAAANRSVLRAAGAVFGDLADLGYDAQWVTVAASDVGACHRRQRVFIVAYRDGFGCGQGSFESVAGETPFTPPVGGDIPLLPTITVAAATGGNMCRGGKRGSELLLPGVARAAAIGDLVPTPAASDITGGGMPRSRRKGHASQLIDAAIDMAVEWGKYGPAIQRQQTVFNTIAPAPTQLNRNSKPQLAATFGEWMMCLPGGHVTDPALCLTRRQQLKMLGNGIVPAQMFYALTLLYPMIGVQP